MSFPGRHLQRCWHLVDAQGQTVGRLATQVATILKGKHKPTFQPNKDMGDHVVVINADKVSVILLLLQSLLCAERASEQWVGSRSFSLGLTILLVLSFSKITSLIYHQQKGSFYGQEMEK